VTERCYFNAKNKSIREDLFWDTKSKIDFSSLNTKPTYDKSARKNNQKKTYQSVVSTGMRVSRGDFSSTKTQKHTFPARPKKGT
jgi:hypothetical protein